MDAADPLKLVGPVAFVGLVATLVGRAIGPALHGAGHGLGSFIDWVDGSAGFATFSFAILALVTASLQLVHTARERGLGLAYRIVAIALGTLVVALVTPAMPLRLPDRGILIVAASSALLALVAAARSLASPQTRALGIALGLVGLSALSHLGALLLSASPLPRMLMRSGALATASVALDGLSLGIAFLWLASRAKTRVHWPTTIAFALVALVFWGAREGASEDASLWQVVAERSVARLSVGPASFVLPEVRQFLELLALGLAGASLFVREKSGAVAASFALLLLARPMTDVPIAATAVALAALTAGLAAAGGRTRQPRQRIPPS